MKYCKCLWKGNGMKFCYHKEIFLRTKPDATNSLYREKYMEYTFLSPSLDYKMIVKYIDF